MGYARTTERWAKMASIVGAKPLFSTKREGKAAPLPKAGIASVEALILPSNVSVFGQV
jgi:hypothetical protein